MTCPSCPSCASRAPGQSVLHVHGTDLVRCPRCGLVRVDPMPSPERAVALYGDAWFRDPRRGYVDYLADDAVYRAEFRRRLRTIRAAGGRGRLLDVGCASGALLLEARAQGFLPAGIEPAPAMAGAAARRSGCPVLAAPVEAALLPPASRDVVVLFDVLEHLARPREVLRRMRLALAPDGLLAVTVPDWGGWWARASGRHWPFLTPWEHLLYFKRRTLADLLRASGYAAIRFAAARTPVSFATLAAKGPLPARLLPRALAHRGVHLPFGTLFALARPDPRPGAGL